MELAPQVRNSSTWTMRQMIRIVGYFLAGPTRKNPPPSSALCLLLNCLEDRGN